MDSSTLVALVGLGCAALITVFLLIRFFGSGGATSGKRRTRIQGFEDRGDGDSYVNLFALFSAAAVEEAKAKQRAEDKAAKMKKAAKKARAGMVQGASKSMASGWQQLKARLAGYLTKGQPNGGPAIKPIQRASRDSRQQSATASTSSTANLQGSHAKATGQASAIEVVKSVEDSAQTSTLYG